MAGNLGKSMVFINTDNSTVEKAYYKGNSSSPKIFDLVVRARLLETKYRCKVYISHVSSKRMIKQGTDSISRALIGEGVTLGQDILSLITFDGDALQRHPHLEGWIKGWLGKITETLNPED